MTYLQYLDKFADLQKKGEIDSRVVPMTKEEFNNETLQKCDWCGQIVEKNTLTILMAATTFAKIAITTHLLVSVVILISTKTKVSMAYVNYAMKIWGKMSFLFIYKKWQG